MLHDIETALPSSTIPFFHLAAGTVGRSENNGSFIIHVDEKSKQTLHQMLKKTYKGQNYYVPWSWKNSDPTTNSNAATFRDAMKAQTSYVTNQWVIPLHGISERQMTIIRPRLMSLASVESIERTKTTTSEGKWSVLVKRTNFT